MTGGETININLVIWLLAGIFLAVGLLYLSRWFVKLFGWGRNHFQHKIFLVRLPKEKPKDENKDTSVQQLREEIAKGETIFAGIGGLQAQKGFSSWFLGRDDHFSFEIVARQGRIYFYFVAPTSQALYLEKQITAHYPEAVVEEVEDYNAFGPSNVVSAGYLKTKSRFVLPLKTYTKMEVDQSNFKLFSRGRVKTVGHF